LRAKIKKYVDRDAIEGKINGRQSKDKTKTSYDKKKKDETRQPRDNATMQHEKTISRQDLNHRGNSTSPHLFYISVFVREDSGNRLPRIVQDKRERQIQRTRQG
jgi:hypothetical protein